MSPIHVSHFSDVLCVWAYIAQVRVEELSRHFADEVVFEYRYFNVFGDVAGKMAAQWQARGGVAAYARHVHEVAARFDHVRLAPSAWTDTVPRSSMPAHLVLTAARALAAADGFAGPGTAPAVLRLDAAVRHAFFGHGLDVSRSAVLLELADREGLPAERLAALLEDGTAHAASAADLGAAAELHVRASPTLSFNEGRQTLTGNVGYRVLEANIRELLHHPTGQQTWC